MKVVTEKRLNNLTQQTETTVYVQVNGVNKYWGKADSVEKVLVMVAQADKWVKENGGAK